MKGRFSMKTQIEKVSAMQIIDSRGNPTVEVRVELSGSAVGTFGIGQAPSGASTGIYEAHELRDGGKNYGGKGVTAAVKNVEEKIAPILKGKNAADIAQIDRLMISLDGTDNKSNLGANAILAVSIACADAATKAYGLPLYRFLGGISGASLPLPMMNILNGGAHSGNGLDVQEFMIMPVSAASFAEGLRQCCEVYHTLGRILSSRGLADSVGDEGGFAPQISADTQALDLICEAIEGAGYSCGRDFAIALDAAASEWKTDETGVYFLPKSERRASADSLIDHWRMLAATYPIKSIEDPLSDDDWDGWARITKELGGKINLVGDDLFATNVSRLKKGISLAAANSALIKPNQIGTVSETIECVNTAKKHGYGTVISHRSGETESTFIADLAVALNAGQIKTGAPCRGERTAKYNRLLRIEKELKK
jgi:enolase